MKKTILIVTLLLNLPFIGFGQENGKVSKRMKFPDYRKPQPDYGIVIAMKGEYMKLGYQRYIPLLGSYNDSINDGEGNGQIEFGFLVKRHYFSLGYGNSSINYNTDSLEINFTNQIYALNYGYNIINNWRFTVRPAVSFKWNRSRLLNTSKGDELLTEYLKNRDLDLRFNQPVGYAGIDVSYNFYNHKNGYDLFNYWKVGAYAGYTFLLLPKPIVRSTGTRLHRVPALNLDNLSFGFYLSWNINWFRQIKQ